MKNDVQWTWHGSQFLSSLVSWLLSHHNIQETQSSENDLSLRPSNQITSKSWITQKAVSEWGRQKLGAEQYKPALQVHDTIDRTTFYPS